MFVCFFFWLSPSWYLSIFPWCFKTKPLRQPALKIIFIYRWSRKVNAETYSVKISPNLSLLSDEYYYRHFNNRTRQMYKLLSSSICLISKYAAFALPFVTKLELREGCHVNHMELTNRVSRVIRHKNLEKPAIARRSNLQPWSLNRGKWQIAVTKRSINMPRNKAHNDQQMSDDAECRTRPNNVAWHPQANIAKLGFQWT